MSQLVEDDEPDISQVSNQSFLTSLDDNELIGFINRLSQKKHQSQNERQSTLQDEERDQILNSSIVNGSEHDETLPIAENSNILPPSSPKLSLDDQIPLAQPQPYLPPSQDNDELEQQENIGLADNGDDDDDPNIIFGDYGTYFAAKSKAQQVEDEEYLTWDHQRRVEQGLSPELPRIFEGCIIHVNGHTRPGIQTLHKLIILYGGKFIHHLSSKGAATHVIATRLTPRKEIEFKNYKVVKPEWITESIAQGKKLKWSDYSVIKLDYGQKRLPFEEQEKEDVHHQDLQDNVQDQDVLDPAAPVEEEDDHDMIPLTQEEPKPLNDVSLDEAIDAKHPDFLKIFFTKSRLHHLSTWKSDLRAEFLIVALNQAKERKPFKDNNKDFKVIMHIDFDCFFATASSLSHPEIDFKNKPVCVSHGGNHPNSSADIASCNYICRKFGVKNGMWVRSAKRLCPELIVLDYDFPTYEKISKQFYQILVDLKPDCIFPVSIDEALLDVTSLIDEFDPVESVNQLCTDLRAKVFQLTKCPVSTGCSHNVLLAKLSLRHAKPEGQFYLHDDIMDFLQDINVRDLPGTGFSIENKLIQEFFPNIHGEENYKVTVGDLLQIEKSRLIKLFGVKTGTKLYDYARGKDNTSIDISENPQEFMRKSVSIDVNWGIRFDNIEQVDNFLFNLGKEMSDRLNKLNMCALQMTLKLLKRSRDAPIEPPKYLGCGKCDAFSKSSKFGVPTDEYRIFGTEARALFRHVGCDPFELRGVSLSVSKLVPKDQVGNQKRLPFQKIIGGQSPMKKPKLNNDSSSPDKGATPSKMGTIKDLKGTQYLIPSDIDSSILEELPSSVQKDIRKQRELSNEPIPEIPKEVDLEVFNSLPYEIQLELKEELRRRKIPINPQNPQTPQKDRKSYLQQVFPIDGSQPEYVRVISPRKSPTKKPNKKLPSPIKKSPSKPTSPYKFEKYDETILNELPTSIRENIIEEWKAYEDANKTEFSKIRENLKSLANEGGNHNSEFIDINTNTKVETLTIENFHQLSTPLIFQKKTRPKDILNLIEKWIIHTKGKGPHIKDLELFQKYIESLLIENMIFALNIIERLELIIKLNKFDICEKWLNIFEKIKFKVKKHCRGKNYKC